PSVSALNASAGMIECRPTTEERARSRSKLYSPGRGWLASGTFHSVRAGIGLSWVGRCAWGYKPDLAPRATPRRSYDANDALERLSFCYFLQSLGTRKTEARTIWRRAVPCQMYPEHEC